MTIHRRALAALAVAALAAVPALGATLATPALAATGDKVTFTVGTLQDVDSLNPFTGVVASAYEVWQVMYDQLSVYSADDFTPSPSLATAVTPSADGLTWTYTIRSGVLWSDGTPLTAKDVAYTFNRIRKGTYEQTNYGNYVANITDVTAPDDTTVVMKTKVPAPIMTHQTLPILPEHVWSGIDETKVKSFTNEAGAVGSGPFVLAERKAGQFIRLTANKNYWGGAPKIDELVYRVYANPDALAQALKKGEVDFADGLKSNVWNSLKNTDGVTTYAGRYPGFNEIGYNTGAALADGTAIGDGHPALKDKKLRQALDYAINRDVLVQRVIGGNGVAATTIIPKIFPAYTLDPANKRDYDPVKARALLDAAGYTVGSDGVRKMPGTGKPLRFRLFARQESTDSQSVAKFVQGWFKDVGVAVDIKVIAEDSLTELLGQGKYDLFEWGWVVEPDPDYQLSTFTCAKRSYKDSGTIYGNLSDSYYCNKDYDALYAKQAGQTDPAARADTVKQMQQLLYDDVPYSVTYFYDDLQAYSSKFTGFVPQPKDHGVLLYQYGAFSYPNIVLASSVSASPSASAQQSVAPAASATASAAAAPASSSGSSGSSVPLVAGGVLVVAAAGAGGLFLARRRRGDASDRE